MAQPEQQARREIDRLLEAAGWRVFDLAEANIHAARGVAIREFPLESGYGFADYLLYVDGKAAGVIEAKKQGATLSGVEFQSSRYAAGVRLSHPGDAGRVAALHPGKRRDRQRCRRASADFLIVHSFVGCSQCCCI